MTLNLDKNKDVLVHAWKEVLDERNPIDWALFGYDGQTYDLNLVSKGAGGLDEMIDDFNSGKIQYALCRVKIKEKNVEKIVLINWQGEGAPLARKGMCANHIGTIKSFFKGVHVSINARTDEDVEPDLVLQTVSKAIAGEGVKMSTAVEPDIGPVGTTYKRVNPQEEINAKAKDDFWRKEEQEEERRKREEQNRLRKFSQDEVKLLRKESQDYFDKEEQEVAMQKIQSLNSSQKTTPSPQPQKINGFNGDSTHTPSSNNNSRPNSTSPLPPKETAAATAAALKASTPMKNNSDLVRQRIKSFDGSSSGPVFPIKKMNGTMNSTPVSGGYNNAIKSPSPTPPPSMNNVNGGSTNNTVTNGQKESLSVLKRKQLFESGGASNMANTVSRKNPAEEIRKAQEEMKKKQELEEKQQEKIQEKVVPVAVSVPIANFDSEEPKVISPVAHFQSSVVEKVIPTSPEPEPQQEKFITPPPAFNNVSYQPVSPPYNNSVPNNTPASVETKSPSPVPPKSLSPQPPPLPKHQPPGPVEQQGPLSPKTPIYEDTSVRSGQEEFAVASNAAASASPVPQDDDGGETITIEITREMGQCARALYDYQAADETEITFDPGEIITNIEKIDDGWWEGLGPRQQYGLFPANYVELLN